MMQVSRGCGCHVGTGLLSVKMIFSLYSWLALARVAVSVCGTQINWTSCNYSCRSASIGNVECY